MLDLAFIAITILFFLIALAYVRVEVPDDAELEVGGRQARLHSAELQ